MANTGRPQPGSFRSEATAVHELDATAPRDDVYCVGRATLDRACTRAGGLLVLLICLSSVAGTGLAETPHTDCERFRHGPLVTERIEDFDLADPERTDVPFIELHYDPAYLFDPATPPRPDGLPEQTELFALNALTGEPLNNEERRKETAAQQGTVTVLIYGSDAIVDLDTAIRNAALAPPAAPYRRTGEKVMTFERLDIPEGLRTMPDAILGKDIFAQFSTAGEVEGVMMCSQPGSVPHPQCSVHFKTETFDVQIGAVRRDELDHLDAILTNVRGFVSCLTHDPKE